MVGPTCNFGYLRNRLEDCELNISTRNLERSCLSDPHTHTKKERQREKKKGKETTVFSFPSLLEPVTKKLKQEKPPKTAAHQPDLQPESCENDSLPCNLPC